MDDLQSDELLGRAAATWEQRPHSHGLGHPVRVIQRTHFSRVARPVIPSLQISRSLHRIIEIRGGYHLGISQRQIIAAADRGH